MDLLIGIIIAIVSFGGGALTGVHYTNKTKNNELHAKIDLQRAELIEANAKLDSLQHLPAKIDTVEKIIVKTEIKIDTLILTNKRILDNTEEIKKDVKTLIKRTSF